MLTSVRKCTHIAVNNALASATPSNVFDAIGLSDIGQGISNTPGVSAPSGEPALLIGSSIPAKSSHTQTGIMLFLMTFFHVNTYQSKLKDKDVDVSNVGGQGVLLARCSFFGDDTLKVSTLRATDRVLIH